MSIPVFPESVQTDAPFETEFKFDWIRPPLHANQRLGWRENARRVKDVRLAAKLHANRVPALPRIEVVLTWVVKDRRRRDTINLASLVKALVDGLVDAGIVPDDTPQYVSTPEARIEYQKGATPHFLLRVREIKADLA